MSEPIDSQEPGYDVHADLTEHQAHYAVYWRANARLIAMLLGVWFLFGVVFSILLVEYLNAIVFFGVPLGFWIAQQGAIYVFVLLIFIYAWRMDVLDRRYNVGE